MREAPHGSDYATRAHLGQAGLPAVAGDPPAGTTSGPVQRAAASLLDCPRRAGRPARIAWRTWAGPGQPVGRGGGAG